MFTAINLSNNTPAVESPSTDNFTSSAISTNSSSEGLAVPTENLQVQLADCREALRQSGRANQRGRIANFELHAQCRNLHFDAYWLHQARADLEADLHKEHGQYVATHQALQHLERSRALLERRVGEQWHMLINLADILHELRLKIDGDKLSEDEKQVDITALFVNKEELTSQVGSLKHLLAEVKEALKTEISKNKEMHANGTELVKARDHRILELERNLICLKQEQRKHKTRKVGGA